MPKDDIWHMIIIDQFESISLQRKVNIMFTFRYFSHSIRITVRFFCRMKIAI